MSTRLKRDIYELHTPGFSIDHVTPPNPDPLLTVSYPCLHWVDHLRDCDPTPEDLQVVEKFLHRSYLHWVEALSLLKSIPDGIRCTTKLENLLLELDYVT